MKHCEKAQATVAPLSLVIIFLAAADVYTAQGKGLVGRLLKDLWPERSLGLADVIARWICVGDLKRQSPWEKSPGMKFLPIASKTKIAHFSEVLKQELISCVIERYLVIYNNGTPHLF